jgi:hypothetical protein
LDCISSERGANSSGVRNIIYFASFTIGDISVYTELGGAESVSETLRNEITTVISRLIQNGAPDLARIGE